MAGLCAAMHLVGSKGLATRFIIFFQGAQDNEKVSDSSDSSIDPRTNRGDSLPPFEDPT
jgi:hypothetical protein